MKLKISLFTALLAITLTTFGQQNVSWDKWSWLMGEWVGEGSGQPGKGDGIFSFKSDLNENILVRKSHAEFPASDNRPATTHDDLMIIYPDFKGTPSNAIYFDNEGHTIQYQITYSGKSIVFLSEKIENVPVFRLTYTLLDAETVNTKFEMSQDGENFFTYIEGKSKKGK